MLVVIWCEGYGGFPQYTLPSDDIQSGRAGLGAERDFRPGLATAFDGLKH